MTTRLIVAVSAMLLAGAASAESPPKKAKLKGEDSSSVKVMIRTIDDGDILWAGGYTLGTKAEVAPGPHVISVMCEFRSGGMTRLLPGEVSLEAESGNTYDLSGTPSADGKTCDAKATVRS